MVSEVETFLDDAIDVDQPMLARALARMQQHVFDDRVGTLAVLHDLFEIASQHVGNLINFATCLFVKVDALQRLLQFTNQLRRNGRKVVDEIQRVFDLVCNARSQLT